eukprot:744149-Rhodomonas_salina.1
MSVRYELYLVGSYARFWRPSEPVGDGSEQRVVATIPHVVAALARLLRPVPHRQPLLHHGGRRGGRGRRGRWGRRGGGRGGRGRRVSIACNDPSHQRSQRLLPMPLLPHTLRLLLSSSSSPGSSSCVVLGPCLLARAEQCKHSPPAPHPPSPTITDKQARVLDTHHLIARGPPFLTL